MAKIYIGENTVLKGNITCNENVSIWHNTVIRTEDLSVSIGSGTNIQDLVMIHTGMPDYSVSIGDNTTIGHSAIIHGCTIGSHCLIGMGAIIMNGAVIPDYCIVGAGALITEGKTFPSRSLILGSPAKAIRPLSEEEIRSIDTNSEEYRNKAVHYLKEQDI